MPKRNKYIFVSTNFGGVKGVLHINFKGEIKGVFFLIFNFKILRVNVTSKIIIEFVINYY